MNYTWKDNTEKIDWKALSTLYRIAPLGEKHPNDLEKVFSNSMYTYFVYDNDSLIGAGRVLADGVDCAYLCDVAVHPDYQGIGLGGQIISKLIESSNHHKKILLYAVPGKEAFYAKFGFKKMKTAMAIFENQEQAIAWQLIESNDNV